MGKDNDYSVAVKQSLIQALLEYSQIDLVSPLGIRLSQGKTEMIGKKLEPPAIKKMIFDSILQLSDKADSGTLTNADIRQKILNLVADTGRSVGQFQMIINAYLKYYCLLKWGEDKAIIKELDCPLDSIIVKQLWKYISSEDKKEYRSKYPFWDIPFKSLYFEDTKPERMHYGMYEFLQTKLETMGNGVRVLNGIEISDKKRIQDFLSFPKSRKK
jgi:hypothetical protein